MKVKILYKGEETKTIRVGEYSGKFEPNQTYDVEFRFALHLTEAEEGFEILPEEETTIESLLKKTKAELVEMFEGDKTEAEKLTKQQLAELIIGGQNNG
jgi:hypothetical protein